MSNGTTVGQINLAMGLDAKGFSQGLGNALGLAKKVGGAIAVALGVTSVAAFAKACIKLGSDLAEVQNVVDVTFGTMSADASEWAEKAIDAFGLSEKVAKDYLGTTGAMAKAFGFSTQQALQQAKSVAGLSADVASFYNLSTDEAYTKLKSIYTGETETLKSLGVVMTQAALDQYAMAKGFGKTTAQMSEQEKVSLRLAFVTDKLSGASGDFARTANGWANQTRVLGLRFDALKATLGQGFINILTPVVKWLNGLVEKLQLYAEVFKQITAFMFGDAGSAAAASMTTAANATEGAQAAAESYKKSLAGFDEINTLKNTASDASETQAEADARAESAVAQTELERKAALIVEHLKKSLGITGKITSWADLMNTKLGDFLSNAILIGGVIAGWKLASGVVNFFGNTNWAQIGKVTAGVGGAVLAADGIASSVTEGVSVKSAVETAVGGTMLGAAIGGTTGGIIGLIVGAALDAVILILQTKDKWLSWGWVEAVTNGCADAILWIEQAFQDTVDWISTAFQNVGVFLTRLWGGIKSVAAAVWKVVKPIADFIVGIGKAIWSVIAKVGEIIAKIIEILIALGGAFYTYVITPFFGFIGNVASFVYDTVIVPILNAITTAWEFVKGVFAGVGTWMFDHIIKPLWDGIIWLKDKAVEVLKIAWTTVVNFVGGLFKSVFNGIFTLIEGAINFFILMLNGAVDIINKIPGVSITKIEKLSIPRLASGGYVAANTPRLALIGDNKTQGEIVAPENKISEAVAIGLNSVIEKIAALTGGTQTAVFEGNIYIAGQKLDSFIVSSENRRSIRSGGKK